MSWLGTHIYDYVGMFIGGTGALDGEIYRNSGNDFFCYKSRILDEWVISASLEPTMNVDSEAWANNWYNYNGYCWFNNASLFQWYDSVNDQWIISSRLGGCVAEEWDGSSYIGDEWWSLSGASPEGEYLARGSLRGTTESAYEGTAKYATWSLVGWRHCDLGTAPAGKYCGFSRTATVAIGGSVTISIVGTEGYKYFGNAPDDESTDYVMGNLTQMAYVAEVGLWL